MRLVSYLRVSSRTQLDGYGLDVQRKACKAWAKAHGHKIIGEYVDEGYSGALPADERPGLTEAIRQLRKPPKADGLIVAKMDRLARAVTVQEAVLALIWRDDGKVFSADYGEVLRDDPEDVMRQAIREMMGVFAGLERRTIAKRLRDGRKAKAADGKHAVGAYAFGTQGVGNGRERDAGPREDERATIARIVELRGAGRSYREIVAVLAAEGLKPRRAETWSPGAVRNVALRAGA